MGVQGDNSSWQVKGSAIAEGEVEPHERSRRLSGQNVLRPKQSQGGHKNAPSLSNLSGFLSCKNTHQQENRRFSSG